MINIIELNSKIIRYVPIGFFIVFIFLIEVFYIINMSLVFNTEFENNGLFSNLYLIEYYKIYNTYFNITAISHLLFTKYIFMFIIAGFILLVAMIGAIILTLNQNFINKRQDIVDQINTNIYKAQKLINIKKN